MRFLFTLIFAFALVAAAKADCPACKAASKKVIKVEFVGADGKPVKVSNPRTLPDYPGVTFTDANGVPRCPCSEKCKCGQVCKCHVGDPKGTTPCLPGKPTGSCKCGTAVASPPAPAGMSGGQWSRTIKRIPAPEPGATVPQDCPTCRGCTTCAAPKRGVSVCVRARRCRVYIFRHRHCR